jgi:hypothetical protein
VIVDGIEKFIVAKSIIKVDLSRINDFAVSKLEICIANTYLLDDNIGSLND